MNPDIDETKLKRVTDMVLEEKAKTFLQPTARGQNMYSYQGTASEVWH